VFSIIADAAYTILLCRQRITKITFCILVPILPVFLEMQTYKYNL